MYIQWLPVLVIVRHFCLLVRKPDLSKLENDSSMTHDEALTGTLSPIIITKLHVMNRHEGVFFKISALIISVNPFNGFIFSTFATVLIKFHNMSGIGRILIAKSIQFFYKQRFFSTQICLGVA